MRKQSIYLASAFLLLLTLFFERSYSQNAIVTENALTGNAASEWDITGAGDASIQGFATDISVNKGSQVSFKVSAPAGVSYNVKIYRLGYYNGLGARLQSNLGNFTGVSQPGCLTDASTGLVDCGNWSSSFSWTVPSASVSGIYIAKLTRNDTQGASHVVFVVRDDAGNSDILVKTSDATWEGYNYYGSNSFYQGTTGYPSGHAVKVSYNRPFINRGGSPPNNVYGLTWLFNDEYPMLRWLERNGYNVSYATCVDMARDATIFTPAKHKMVMSVGHDEYWSNEERTKFENARGAGVNLAFFSGNEMYWKTRWENSTDGSNTPYRTLVCYKEGDVPSERGCGTKCDPLATVWTGLWRDGAAYPSADGNRPENAVTGQISWDEAYTSMQVPSTYKSLRFWRNTSIASLANGSTATLPDGTLEYEYDVEQPAYASTYPAGRITLSSTSVASTRGLGTVTHKMSLYRHSSGALVFGAGTVQWSWGLDPTHDRSRGSGPSTDMQQATVNLFADMGVQPATLQSGIVAATKSTDATAPTAVITSPANGATVSVGTIVTISGTASDVGGVLAGVEVSVDGGATWNVATGTTSWSYSWSTPASNGTATIKVRGFDDSGNYLSAANATTITVNVGSGGVTPPTPGTYNIFTGTPALTTVYNDGSALELGVKFQVTTAGLVTGVRFYKVTGNTGTHTGRLYSSTGTVLASAVFANETASGWQTVTFSTPVSVTTGTTYVASYHSASGNYSAQTNFFTAALVNGPLRGLADGEDGVNGLYRYTATPAIPNSGYLKSNYGVDVVFTVPGATDVTPPVISSIVATPNTNGTAVINWTTDEASDSRVDYGTASGSLTLNASNATLSTSHTITLTGLTQGQIYYFRVTSKDASNNSATSPVAANAPASFTMPAAVDITPPVITVVAATPNSNGTAVITWTTDEASDSRVDYGTTSASLTLNATNATMVTAHTITLTGLTLGQVYFFRVTSKDASNNSATSPVAANAPASFTMPAAVDNTPPTITLVAAAPNSNGTAVITWTTNEASDTRVDYGTASASLTLNATNASMVTAHTITLTGLANGQVYYYRVTSKDASNNSATSPIAANPPSSFTVPVVATVTVCGTDDTNTNFSAGTLGTSLVSVLDSNGALMLKPALSEDFTATTVPTGWTAANWVTGGATSYGGSATVSGSHVYTTGTYAAGASLEFNAKFTAKDFQNVGFSGSAAFGTPWVVIGRGSVGATNTGLYVRTSSGVNTLLSSSLLNAYHRYKIMWNATNFTISVDGVQVATATQTVTTAMNVQISDYNTGGTGLAVDWVRVSPYATTATYTSRVIDAGSVTYWKSASWNTILPTGTSIAISYRTGNTATPDATWSAWTAVTNGGTLTGNTRYLQYQAVLTTTVTASTPVLKDISFSCGANPVAMKKTGAALIDMTPNTAMPGTFTLDQNHPNPFRDRTIIRYSVPHAATVRITVHDLYGRLIRVVENATKMPGIHTTEIDMHGMGKGVYIYRLVAEDVTITRKMVVE